MQIFLSHATADRELVAQIKVAVGVRAQLYCAEDDGKAGLDFNRKIQAQLKRSSVVIVLLTERGAESAYVQQEIGYAKRAGKLIIPLVSRTISTNSLGMLQGTEYIVVDGENPLEHITSLRSRVNEVVTAEEHSDLILLTGAVLLIVGLAVLSKS